MSSIGKASCQKYETYSTYLLKHRVSDVTQRRHSSNILKIKKVQSLHRELYCRLLLERVVKKYKNIQQFLDNATYTVVYLAERAVKKYKKTYSNFLSLSATIDKAIPNRVCCDSLIMITHYLLLDIVQAW